MSQSKPRSTSLPDAAQQPFYLPNLFTGTDCTGTRLLLSEKYSEVENPTLLSYPNEITCRTLLRKTVDQKKMLEMKTLWCVFSPKTTYYVKSLPNCSVKEVCFYCCAYGVWSEVTSRMVCWYVLSMQVLLWGIICPCDVSVCCMFLVTFAVLVKLNNWTSHDRFIECCENQETNCTFFLQITKKRRLFYTVSTSFTKSDKVGKKH